MRPRLSASLGRSLRLALVAAILTSAASRGTATEQPLQQSQASIEAQQSVLRSACVEPRLELPRPAPVLPDEAAATFFRERGGRAPQVEALTRTPVSRSIAPLRLRRRVPRLGDDPPWLG